MNVNIMVRVFDRVEFTRWNEHSKRNENFVAVWMINELEDVYIHFGKASSDFCVSQDTQVGGVFLLGCKIREVYPATNEYPAPAGYTFCPERRVCIYPRVGGYASIEIEARKRAKIEMRKANAGW